MDYHEAVCASKHAYSSKKDVKRAIRGAKRRNMVMWYYDCRICGMFHLTHRNPKDSLGPRNITGAEISRVKRFQPED